MTIEAVSPKQARKAMKNNVLQKPLIVIPAKAGIQIF